MTPPVPGQHNHHADRMSLSVVHKLRISPEQKERWERVCAPANLSKFIRGAVEYFIMETEGQKMYTAIEVAEIAEAQFREGLARARQIVADRAEDTGLAGDDTTSYALDDAVDLLDEEYRSPAVPQQAADEQNAGQELDGVDQSVDRQPHKLEDEGSSPSPASVAGEPFGESRTDEPVTPPEGGRVSGGSHPATTVGPCPSFFFHQPDVPCPNCGRTS